MWFNPLETIAAQLHMRLVILAKDGCPAAIASFRLNDNATISEAPWPACTAWHAFALATISKLKPVVVVLVSSVDLDLTTAPGLATPAVVQADFAAFMAKIPTTSKIIVLGGFPSPASSGATPTLCLSRPSASVKSCAFTEGAQETAANTALAAAATAEHASVIDQSQWLCATTCPAEIAGQVPYTVDGFHLSYFYVQYLTGVLKTALVADIG
jgi:hypothetical protein